MRENAITYGSSHFFRFTKRGSTPLTPTLPFWFFAEIESFGVLSGTVIVPGIIGWIVCAIQAMYRYTSFKIKSEAPIIGASEISTFLT